MVSNKYEPNPAAVHLHALPLASDLQLLLSRPRIKLRFITQLQNKNDNDDKPTFSTAEISLYKSTSSNSHHLLLLQN